MYVILSKISKEIFRLLKIFCKVIGKELKNFGNLKEKF